MKALFALILANLHGLHGLFKFRGIEVHRVLTVGNYNRRRMMGASIDVPERYTLVACHDCGRVFLRDERTQTDKVMNAQAVRYLHQRRPPQGVKT